MTVVLTESSLGSPEHVLWECMKLVSVVWMLLVVTQWQAPELSGGMPGHDQRPVEGWSSRWGDTASAVLTALCALPLVIAVLFLALLVFVFVFWLEVFVVYEWGDCIHLGCRSAHIKYGFIGWLASSIPSVLEAILFTLFSDVSIFVADLLLWIRNYQFHDTRMLFRFATIVTTDAIGKLGTFGILALLFVPAWDDESTLPGLPSNFSTMNSTEGRIARNGVDCSDLPDAAILGRGALLCLRRRLDPDYRRWLFQQSMKGPFVVVPFVSILRKVLLPMAFQKVQARLWRCERRQRGAAAEPCCCSCRVTRFMLRAAGLIFAYDSARVGYARFLCFGSPFQLAATEETEGEMPEDSEVREAGTDSEANGADPKADSEATGADPKADYEANCADPNADSAAKGNEHALKPRPKLIRQALREVLTKGFKPEDVVLDSLLSIQWVGFFTAVWPWGCIPTLAAWILQTRTAFVLLLIGKQRAFPHPPHALQQVAKYFIVVMAHLTALWHVAMSLVTYNYRLSSIPAGVLVGALVGLWLAVVVVMWFAAWVAHICASRCRSAQKPSYDGDASSGAP